MLYIVIHNYPNASLLEALVESIKNKTYIIYSYFKLTGYTYTYISSYREIPKTPNSIIVFTNETIKEIDNNTVSDNNINNNTVSDNNSITINNGEYIFTESRGILVDNRQAICIHGNNHIESLESAHKLEYTLLDYPECFSHYKLLLGINYLKYGFRDRAIKLLESIDDRDYNRKKISIIYLFRYGHIDFIKFSNLTNLNYPNDLDVNKEYIKYIKDHNLYTKPILAVEAAEAVEVNVAETKAEVANIINLDSRKDRWLEISSKIKEYFKINRISAIYDKVGWIGCFRSHQKAILSSRENMTTLVLEDDCGLLSADKWSGIKRWLDSNLDKWDVYLGGVTNVDTDEVYIIDKTVGIYGLKFFTSAHFIYYNSSIYNRIIDYTPDNSVYNPIDIFISSIEGIKIVTSVPFIATQRPSYSNIESIDTDYIELYIESERVIANTNTLYSPSYITPELDGPLEIQLCRLYNAYLVALEQDKILCISTNIVNVLFKNILKVDTKYRFVHNESGKRPMNTSSNLLIRGNYIVNSIVDKAFVDLLDVGEWRVALVEKEYPDIADSLLVIYNSNLDSGYYKNAIGEVLDTIKEIKTIYYINREASDFSSIASISDKPTKQIKYSSEIQLYIILKCASLAKVSDGSPMSYFAPSRIFITPNNYVPKYETIELPNIKLNSIQGYLILNPIYNPNLEITIIISVRNTPKHYLETCLESLYNQTSGNWKAIVVYDGCKYTEPIKYKDSRITEYYFTEWVGVVEVNKKAIDLSNSPIIGFLDSDDALEDTAIEDVLATYSKYDKSRVFVYTNYWICDSNINKLAKGPSTYVKKSLLNDRCGNPFRTFRTSDYYLTPRGFDNRFIFGGEDQDILFQLETIGVKPIFLDKCLYLYRDTANSLSKSKICNLNLEKSILINTLERYNLTEPHYTIIDNNVYIGNSEIFLRPNSARREIKSPLNQYFDNIYVIYLNHETTRTDRMKRRLDKLEITYEMWLGVDGKAELTDIYKDKKDLGQLENFKYVGEYGYLETMRRILTDAKNKKYRKFLVLENDVMFSKDFNTLWNCSITKIPMDNKLLFLGLSGPWSTPTKNLDILRYNPNFSPNYIRDFRDVDGSFAVGYDYSIIDKILEIMKRPKYPYDTELFRYISEKEDAYCIYPYLAIADVTRSTIREDSNKNIHSYYRKTRVMLHNYC
jgi:GR25 family glycosyltransferase involved in LPS biosynthesis